MRRLLRNDGMTMDFEPEYAIILAADVPTSSDVLNLVKAVGPIVDGVKIGVPTILESGIGVLGKVRDLIGDKALLLDLKTADIGFKSHDSWQGTNWKIITALANSGVTHVTVHGFPGPLSVAECVAAGRDSNIKILLLPLMSHMGAGIFFDRTIHQAEFEREIQHSGFAIGSSEMAPMKTITDGILALGELLDVYGYIGPSTRPNDLKRYREFSSKAIWCPGFGRQDRLGRTLSQQLYDWARIVGPNSSAIIGSTIYGAEDPIVAAHQTVGLRDELISTL
jgi:orotidine 5'-phosphate decarboxylase subfamily 1